MVTVLNSARRAAESQEKPPADKPRPRTKRFEAESLERLGELLPAYEFLELIAVGGMGAVYKARQPHLDRFVAIKVLPADLGEDQAEFAERFRREAKVMAKLHHPNIVGVHEFGETSDGRLYLVMEYVDGHDLFTAIQSGQVTPEHVQAWIPPICDALECAHARGIVHRDVKPSNILIDYDGEVKLIDFGLVQDPALRSAGTAPLTEVNFAMGTLEYLSPEALEGEEVDYRSDIYALGVILYEMLTGKVPRGAWQAPSDRVPGLDPRFDDLVIAAMQRERGCRMQAVGELRAGLAAIRRQPQPLGVVEGRTAECPDRDQDGCASPALRAALEDTTPLSPEPVEGLSAEFDEPCDFEEPTVPLRPGSRLSVPTSFAREKLLWAVAALGAIELVVAMWMLATLALVELNRGAEAVVEPGFTQADAALMIEEALRDRERQSTATTAGSASVSLSPLTAADQPSTSLSGSLPADLLPPTGPALLAVEEPHTSTD